jgi:diguanylate cyclase (GGDEF)-like protein/PAS domain S-box-containing protein
MPDRDVVLEDEDHENHEEATDRGGAADERGADESIDLRAREGNEFASLGSALPLGVMSTIGMGTAVYVNHTAMAMLGRDEESLLRRAWESAIHPDDRAELAGAVAVVLDTAARQRVLLRPADDPARWLEMTIAYLGRRDRPTGWIATIDDVSERVRTDEQLTHLATHDPLTLLPNRTLLADRLRLAGRRLARADVLDVLAVLFIDLDDFKSVNDRFGHAAGDRVLVEVARRMTGVLRGTDTVARLGGDEFVVLSELAGADDVPELVARVQRSIEHPVRVVGGVVSVRASVGVAVAPAGVTDIGDLLDEADHDMYRRKAARKAPDRA